MMRTITGLFLKRFTNDRRGVITVMLALLLPIMVGFIGLGIEVGMWFQNKRDLQTAADASAIAGAFEAYEDTATTATILAAAAADATLNGYDSATDSLTATNPPTTGPNTADADAVEVNISSPVNLLFATIFLENAVTINARAVANAQVGGEQACVLALDGTAARAINVSGTASVDMDGCEVATRSTASNSINVSGAADLTVDCVSTAGDTSGTIVMDVCASAKTGIRQIDDPYADLTVPAESTDCDTSSNFSSTDGDIYSTANNDTNGDGVVVFCGNFSINGGDTVTFDSDTIYVFNGGDLTMNGGSNVSGTNITFVFTGSGNDWASASVSGGGTISISAQTTGDYAGILFYQDGDATDNNSNNFSFTGGSSTEMTGVIYVPENDVDFSGGNETDDNGCLQIVASQVSFGGNADIENQCAGTGVDPIYTSFTVQLIE